MDAPSLLSRVSDLDLKPSTFVYGFVASYALFYILPKLIPNFSLRAIPTVGCPNDTWLSSWIGAFRYIKHATEMVEEGYRKFPGQAFKIPNIDKWIVVVSGEKLVKEIGSAPEDVLSFQKGVNDLIQTKYTLGPQLLKSRYHVNVVRSPLTRNIGPCYEEIRDELVTAFDDEVNVKSKEWSKISIGDAIMRVVCRTSNRFFVGLPICTTLLSSNVQLSNMHLGRNPDYIDLNITFTIDVVKAALIISLFPKVLRPIAGSLLTKVPSNLKRAEAHLGALIQHRLDMEEKHGSDWEGKPNDLISWLLEDAEGEERLVKNLVNRVLLVNFAAIHTTSTAFTNAIYDLASRPSYIEPLRQEVQQVIEEEGGWSKAAIGKMRKLDSFVKESQRYSSGPIVMHRMVLKDYTLSDGTFIAKGNIVAVAAQATHYDPENYCDPSEFDGFRYSNMREGDGESTKHQSISPSLIYLAFGNGRHACPGRFFAMLEVRNLLAHTLMNYDLKFEDEGVRPENQRFLSFNSPNRKAQVMMRKRNGN